MAHESVGRFAVIRGLRLAAYWRRPATASRCPTL